MPKKRGFYSTTPAVPEKRIAQRNPVPGPRLGTNTPTMVVIHPGRINGLGTDSLRRTRAVRPHSFNHSIRSKLGNMQLSGTPKAHRIGKR